ncbi:hypothetical protein VKT23_009878 [Stygiomarasmius scandens]|uniref:HAT C-terminal dimerisation domain-containing protein n=1 Tax=Marasmiellus scandens TaxID=2682957 RepID=A0ABR1JG67_9AGAR
MDLAWYSQDAKDNNSFVNIVGIWQEHLLNSDLDNPSGVNSMVVLAMRIMSMVPNSAGIECRFSKFGAIQTKTQNQIDAQDITEATTAQPNDDTEADGNDLAALDHDTTSDKEGDDRAGDVDTLSTFPSFDEIVEDMMNVSDEEEDQPLDEDHVKLQNLFDYPSLSDADSQTFSFMMEFWQHGENNLHADTIRHEVMTLELTPDPDSDDKN